MADSRSRGFEAQEQKLQDKLDKLQSQYDGGIDLLEQQGGGIAELDTSRMKGVERLRSKIDEVKQQLKDLKSAAAQYNKARGDGSTRTSTQVKEPIMVDSSEPPMPKKRPAIVDTPSKNRPATVDTPSRRRRRRPATVDTQSKKPLAKRIMEALGDKRSMEDATRDRRMTEEMERERMGQKKGGMGQKKKDSVKKAYGGMVKKKHGGSANKVNMKAGFTRRGCLKG